jgi:hypothetical protein
MEFIDRQKLNWKAVSENRQNSESCYVTGQGGDSNETLWTAGMEGGEKKGGKNCSEIQVRTRAGKDEGGKEIKSVSSFTNFRMKTKMKMLQGDRFVRWFQVA